MRRLTLMFAAAMLMLSTSGCVSGKPKTIESRDIAAVYLDNGYFVDAEVIAKIIAVADPDTRRVMFYDNSLHLQGAWVVSQKDLLWLMKQAAKGRRLPDG